MSILFSWKGKRITVTEGEKESFEDLQWSKGLEKFDQNIFTVEGAFIGGNVHHVYQTGIPDEDNGTLLIQDKLVEDKMIKKGKKRKVGGVEFEGGVG